MKIEVFEISSKEDKVYQELLDQYKTNAELQKLLNSKILMGVRSLITELNAAIDRNDKIKVYLIKDVDNNTFLWVIGKILDGDLAMYPFIYPLLSELSENLQLEVRRVLIEKGLINSNERDYYGKKIKC